MTILQREPLPNTHYHPIQIQSHRNECWLEGWVEVPPQWEELALASFEHCELLVVEGVLQEIRPLPKPTPSPEPPSPEEDRDALLVDLDYRMTLLELGVM